MTGTSPGKPLPFGATPVPGGVRFAVFSRAAASVTLLLFERPDSPAPCAEIPFDPQLNRTGDVWHAEVQGVGTGACYLWRVDGPWAPVKGHRFDPGRLLLDPYVKAVGPGSPWVRGGTRRGRDGRLLPPDAALVPKGIVVDDRYDWQGDRPLNRSMRHTVIYEAHVRGLTRHPSSGVEHPGTFRGVAEMAPALVELGITAVELLPVQEFDDREPPRGNYWGYNTMAFFAPKAGYAGTAGPGTQVTEFKDMVRRLHAAGIEVILDIVFNHTAEGDEAGPTFCFRGWDNSIYYMLDDEGGGRYRSFTGCGNTMNCNHPIVRTLIMDCLRYWVVEMHVDGFRFDLGSVLGRDTDGRLLENPPILERIAEDPVLRHTKIIAEAWDAAGAYQVGWFPGGRWAEWNDRFRDDVRRFWRGDPGMVPALATRLAGSSDLYLRDGRKPFHSINFVTSHDGFTLNDLVSYAQKHNEANGEGNRDGATPESSCNYGVEGPSADARIEAVRGRQVRNFLATLLLSQGTPMLLAGDEIRRTQAGNNNAWCQDNELSWIDWGLRERNAGLLRFCRELIAFRQRHPAFRRPEFYSGRDANHNRLPDIGWFTETAAPADWSPERRTLMLVIDGNQAEIDADRDDNDLAMLLNASENDVLFTLPPVPQGKEGWYRVIDTGLPSPADIAPPGEEERATRDTRMLTARSLVVYLSR